MIECECEYVFRFRPSNFSYISNFNKYRKCSNLDLNFFHAVHLSSKDRNFSLVYLFFLYNLLTFVTECDQNCAAVLLYTTKNFVSHTTQSIFLEVICVHTVHCVCKRGEDSR